MQWKKTEHLQLRSRRNNPWDTERLCLSCSHSTFLLNHPLSLPCLLFLIFRAALQYFYQMISPSSSAALMFMKMILHRNASCMPRCHCLSSSLESMCMYKCVCVRKGWRVGVEGWWVKRRHNWLTSLIYNYVGLCLRMVSSGEMCVCACVRAARAFVWTCYCYFCVSCDWRVGCVKVHLLPFVQPPPPSPFKNGIIHRT